MASLWNNDARAALQGRMRQLTPDAQPRWGKMNCPQMLAHLNDSVRMAIGDLPVRSVGGPLRYPPLRELLIYVLPMPKGVPTAPELIARVDRARWDEEAGAFPLLLERFAARGQEAVMPTHPAFGVLSRRAWGVLTHRHIDHHLRQFGV